MVNNDLQTLYMKLKIEQHKSYKISAVNLGALVE